MKNISRVTGILSILLDTRLQDFDSVLSGQLFPTAQEPAYAILTSSISKQKKQTLYMALGNNNDEEFDWEAAVAEIDDACDRSALAEMLHENAFPTFVNGGVQNSTYRTLKQNKNEVDKKLSKAIRQSTLDNFVEVSEKHLECHQTYHPSSTTDHANNDVLYNKGGIKSDIDPVAAQTWTYPVNVPLRDYQFSIVKTALFSNTLVSLPTGLGKTLIAAVVMYNYYRWFPAGKIVFTAPSRPLVMQQIEACHNIVGIPQEWTIDMTGQMNPAQRSGFWQSKRVFFVTPQVLEKDIQSGSCLVKQLVCLVVDEAHRAMGNYAYCVVVREIMAVPVQLRMLALTATPGSKQATIQTVIDNLQISTLEYRNENDPDVRQYTHNKNIELITVAMDKESINVSNLLLEVITPVVQKLCSLGVFYSKDVTKLTPFEFLTAREKFRQSPPAFLAQPQYGEVESYFGVAITLYHIYKLLFSHGIRPALEMLQKKLQQGSFARAMGRNATLWKAKAFMQQRIRHGDPNPKVLKMKEIIVEHFQSKDLGNSRVIIFTNFRESVKDIMESLVILGDAVKAMEFIGQSSGKASKGQSQKVQQAVLQKFRAGGYNTIVATSIGEEGLDIMEVDLVICFDANVSPLRMIQRMGRTGRKRDGRVVILASEGSELQGYLKKQAKGKALGKHMYNGGINSFNFHSSPRMVPHGYQPEVQFVEMSIEKFIHRGRRSREDAASTDPGVDELSESEMNLLEKYFDSSTEEFWKPSLIAFPHYQLFPSRVYNVKHSFRTTEMLIDTSQFLQEHKSPFMASKNFLLNNEVGTSSMEHLQHVSDDANNAELEGKWADITVPRDMVPEQLHFHPCSPSEQSDKVVTDSQGFLHKMDASGGQCCEGRGSLGKHKSTTSGLSMHGASNAAMQDKNLHGTFCEGNDLLATHKSPSSEVLNTEFVSIPYKEMMHSVSCSSKTSLHRCLFNTGFVSVSSDGRVIISSPPTLPLLNWFSSCVPFMSGNNSAEPLSGRPVSPPMKMGSPKQIEVGINPSFSTKQKAFSEVFRVSTPPNDIMAIDSPEQIKVSSPDGNLVSMIDSLKQIKVSTPPSCQRENSIDVGGEEPQTPPCSGKLFGIPEEVVLATPDSCYAKFPCDFKESILPPVSNAYARYIDFSPYLTNLAERGIVTEPPTLAFSKDGHAATKSLQQPICDSVNENSKTLAFGIVASSWEVEVPITYLREKGITDHAINTGTEVCKTPEGNKFAAPAHVSPEILKSSNMKLKGLTRNVLHDNAEQLNFECLSISNSSAMKGHSTPLVKHKSNSCSEDWYLSSADAKSVQKPQKFKRLCKYKKHSEAQVSASPSEMRPKRNKKLDINNGKRHSEISVHAFIDDEAEVSSDERVSTDEDDENDGNEEASETDDFIDDRLELTAAPPTQADGGQFDMMAMYRRSLFIQSPTEELHPRARLCQSRVYSGEEISDHSEMSNASAETYAGSHVISVDNSSSPSPMKDTGIKTLCSSLPPFQNAVEESLIVDLDTCSSKEKNSNIARKRKFTLQQADPTEKLTVLENRVSSSVVRNLREDFDTPTKQIKFGEPIDHTFDDDLFEGLDLDALEAEAAKMARSRSNMNPTVDKSCWSNTDPLDVGCSTKPASFWNAATNIKEIKRTSVQVSDKHDYINDQGNNAVSSTKVLEEKKLETANDIDMVFFCSPSFDLGI